MRSKLKVFDLQTKKNYAFIDKKFKKLFIKRKFLSKLILNKKDQYNKIKHLIKNKYLNSIINDENMSFIYTFCKIIKISNKHFVNTMKSFRGLPHRLKSS